MFHFQTMNNCTNPNRIPIPSTTWYRGAIPSRHSVCVCVYTLPPVGFFRLHDIFDIREKFGSTIFCCECSVSFCQVPSSLFLNLSYFTSKDENSSHRLLERKRYDIMFGTRRKDDIY